MAVEPGIAWLAAQQRSACDSCRAQSGCGQAVLSRLMRRDSQPVRALLPAELQSRVTVGGEVTVAIPMHTVVLGSLFIYLLPIVSLLMGAVLASVMGLSEPMVALSGFIGLLAGGALVRSASRVVSSYAAVQPSVVECVEKSFEAIVLTEAGQS